MKDCLLIMLLLAIVLNTFGETQLISWTRNRTLLQQPRVIEIVEWRQPVCVMPAKDVPPCQIRVANNENKYSGAKKSDQTKPIEAPALSDAVLWTDDGIINDEETLHNYVVRSLLESSELVIDDVEKLADPDRTLKLPLKTPEIDIKWQSTRWSERSSRSTQKRISIPGIRPSQTYVTKVYDLPVTATLVAHGCLPDLGFPLCAGHQASPSPEINLMTKSEEDKLIHKLIEDHKKIVSFDLTPSFEKLKKLRDPSRVAAFLNTLIDGSFYTSTYLVPLVDLLLPENFDVFDEFLKKEDVGDPKDVQDPCDKARKTSVLKFQLRIIANANYAKMLDEVEACLRYLHTKQSTMGLKQKSHADKSTKSQSISWWDTWIG